MGVRAWGGGRPHLSDSATPQQLVMCFASQNQIPSAVNNRQKPLMLLPKKREFPRQTEREEEQIAVKNFRIWEYFLDFKHLQNYSVDADSLVGCS